jgi:hypothetical protein
MKKYNRYHSTIKTSYALGIQQQVLPHSFTSSIPRSTTQNWKELSPKNHQYARILVHTDGKQLTF